MSTRSMRWRRHWRLAVGFPLVLALLVGAAGTKRVRALSSSRARSQASVFGNVGAGQTDLFDTTKVHSITLRYKQADYERMLDQYFTDGTKDFLPADITIDGTTLRNVGIRLKGNATLGRLTSPDGRTAPGGLGGPGGFGGFGGGAPPGGGVPAGGVPAGGAPPGGVPAGGAPPGGGQGPPAGQFPPGGGQRPPGGQAPGGGFPGGGGGFPGGGGGTALSTDTPESLPWLVRFDEFGADQRYQGHREIAIRVAQGGTQTTVLNEALSLALLDDDGDPAAAATYAAFRVNDRTTTLRLVVENPDGQLAAEDFADRGALYKSLASGRFTYRGEDPLQYETSFRQVSGNNDQDLQPLINFIKWVNQVDDAGFDAGLAQRLEVESFARYAAWQNLLVNFDDMAGPGQNYLLFYDVATERFTVATWDMNLALGNNTAQGPFGAGGFGGGGGGGGFPGGGGGLGGHKLKERFLASATFKPMYERVYRELYQKYFAGGRAATVLDRWAALLSSVTIEGVDPVAVARDIAAVRTFLADRTDALATNEVVTAG